MALFYHKEQGGGFVGSFFSKNSDLEYNLKAMKVLVVEDEHKIANSIKKGLELENFVADVAFDGTEGFDMAASGDYDVIILDLMLPGMDGVEICKELRSEGVHTPILMLTAKKQAASYIILQVLVYIRQSSCFAGL